MRVTKRPVNTIHMRIMNIVKDRHPQPPQFVLLLFSDIFEGCMLVTFAFWINRVFSLDEQVVKLHPFIQVVHTHGVTKLRMILPQDEFISVVFPDVSQYAPVMFFKEFPVSPHIVSRQTRHVTVAWQRITHCRHHDVCKVLIENWCCVFLKFRFSLSGHGILCIFLLQPLSLGR